MPEKSKTRKPSPEQFQFRRFRFTGRYEALELVYGFDDGGDLVETIGLAPDADRLQTIMDGPCANAFEQALKSAAWLLHLVAGVSYYKAYVPSSLRIDTWGAPDHTLQFLEDLYRNGLAEFAYVNDLDLSGRLNFVNQSATSPPGPIPLPLSEKCIVALGGGKDSLVSVEWLKALDAQQTLVAVGSSPLIAETAQASGLPFQALPRQLASELSDLNAQGALNGHVPVTAINSLILIIKALLEGADSVVFSNERSANVPNLRLASGQDVNHQYSKSLAFEKLLRNQIRQIVTPSLQYFSLLRPYRELRLLQAFAGMEIYHPLFSSCNRNFHLSGPRTDSRWCGQCPKCRFTALGLSLFMPVNQVNAILGHSMLNDPEQISGFRALCGLGTNKPFECVGEVEESRLAVGFLSQRKETAGLAVIKSLAPELPIATESALTALLTPGGEHCIPERYIGLLDAAG